MPEETVAAASGSAADSPRTPTSDATLSSPSSSFKAVGFAATLKERAGRAKEIAEKSSKEVAINLKAAKAAAAAAAHAAQNPDDLPPISGKSPKPKVGVGFSAPSPQAAAPAEAKSSGGRSSLSILAPPPRASLARRASRGRRDSALYRPRSDEALEGIALLRHGCEAVKLTRKGKPRLTTFKLSADETKLTWQGRSVALKKMGTPRSILLADVLEVQYGTPSAVVLKSIELGLGRSASVFPGRSLAAAVSTRSGLNLGGGDVEDLVKPHLAISLPLLGGVPQAPADVEDAGDEASTGNSAAANDRGALDVCLRDEETFRLWVAALVALTSEARLRPTAYPSPYAPLHASAAASLARLAPPDASCYERCRDSALRALNAYAKTRIFVAITTVWVLCVAGFGAMYGFLLFGWHGMEADAANDLGNVAMQVLTGLFSYILALTLPWRLANLVHILGGLLGGRRSCAAGCDLYGRPTNGIWFHIPPLKRLWIVMLLVGNAAFQYATQACRVAWPSYADSQAMPGVLWINVTFVSSIVCGIGSGIAQGCAESVVRKADPGRFPPTPIEYALEAWRREREEAHAHAAAGAEPEAPVVRLARRLSTAGVAMSAAAAMPTRRVSVSAVRRASLLTPNPMGHLPLLDGEAPKGGPAAAKCAPTAVTPRSAFTSHDVGRASDTVPAPLSPSAGSASGEKSYHI